MPEAAALYVVVLDHDQMRRAGEDLLMAAGAAVRLSFLAGDRSYRGSFYPCPNWGYSERSFDGLEAGGTLPGGPMLAWHQTSTSRMNSAATAPSSLPVSASGLRAPRTLNE